MGTRTAVGRVAAGWILAGVAVGAEVREAPLEGRGAAIEFRGEGEADVFAPGSVLFTDRNYKVAECPAWLEGQRFLRNGINADEFRIVGDGVLTLLTPEPDHPRATTQVRALESMGFVWIRNPGKFQLFGAQPFDLTRIYQREVKAGQRFRLGKWTVLVGFESAERRDPVVRPWGENTGEQLYNGIVLPEEWPPDTIDPQDTAPMPVPYLDHPPKIIPIDVGRQLFVDDFLVESTDLTRTYHMPRKYEGNPVLKPETELEDPAPNNAAATPKSGGVWWDPADRVFKMWYEAGWIHTICYATSKDGLNWDRPNLDVRPGTNQVLPLDLKPDSWTVVPDWDAPPEHRWTMRMQPPGKAQPGLSMTSPDGIHWSNREWTGDAGDRSTHFYNPFRKRWVHSIRSGFRGRSRHYWESETFLAERYWEPGEAVVWAAADREDPPDPEIGDTAQLYNLDAVAYESIMLGMFEIHRGPANDKCSAVGLPKITELNFATSRDGFHWHRPDRRAHIPAERRDVWDRGYVQPIGNICTIQGDKLWIYYTAYRGDTNRVGVGWMQNGMYHDGATGVAFLRRDGFASMDAGAQAGTLTTRPVTFSGRSLFVNANAIKGSLRAEVRDPEGNPIPPFTLDNCAAFNGDSTIEPIRWKGDAGLASLAGRPVRFHFELTGGSIYAFWVSRDDTGRSDGYVAGGGPGYTGPTDTVGRSSLGTATNLDRVESATRAVTPWVAVKPGTFTMGALPGADCLRPCRPVEAVGVHGKKIRVDEYQGPHWDEQPVHDVHISRAFEIGARRVTLGEFLRFKPEHADVIAAHSLALDPASPVTLVTWDEAQAYCRWLGEAEGSTCRLPTEAEWEIAAGHASPPGLEGVGDGVLEWCYDWWAPYAEGAETDPLGPKEGVFRVIRGRVDDLGRFRTTDRSAGLPEERLPYVSFRVARVSGATGRHRASPPPAAVFQNVTQTPKSWTRDADPSAPVFHGGFTYIDKTQPDAARLPHWGRHHVPSITWCDNGDLLATVMTSPNDGSDQMAVLVTRLRDGSDTWDPPARLFILPDRDVDAAILHRDDDGTLVHFNAMGKGEQADFAARSVSRDNGATWSRPDVVRFHRSAEADEGFRADLAFVHLDMIRLNDGAWGMARDVVGHRPYGTALFKSIDRGMSWHEMSRLGWRVDSFGKKGEQAGWIVGWHAAVAALRDGSFMAIGRTGDIDGRAPVSRSTDHGRTWTYAPSDLSPVSSSQRPIIKRLDEGPLMLVHYTDSSDVIRNKEPEQGIEIRDAEGAPRRIFGTFTALSFDEGATWAHHKALPVRSEAPDETDRMGYYSAAQSPDGMIHLISTHRYYRFNLAWLKQPMPAVK